MSERPPARPGFTWYESRTEYERHLSPGFQERRKQDQEVARHDVWRAHCGYCGKQREFTVSVGLLFVDDVDLRNGLVCRGCGLNNRQRLLYMAVEEIAGGARFLRDLQAYMPERVTVFYDRLAARAPHLVGSEYLSPEMRSGETRPLARPLRRGLRKWVPARFQSKPPAIRHEDLRATSFDAGRFDLVVHGEVLEHVARPEEAWAEIYRILAPGGATVFTVPFLAGHDENEVRARIEADGTTTHLLPPEIHGNPMLPGGSLVFQNFGWALLKELRSAGFVKAAVGVLADAGQALTSNNSSYQNYMEPVVVRAEKPGNQDLVVAETVEPS